MFAIATFAIVTLTAAAFVGKIADALRPAPKLEPVRVRGPYLAAFDMADAIASNAWSWA